MKQGTLFYDKELSRYNFFMMMKVNRVITAASIVARYLNST